MTKRSMTAYGVTAITTHLWANHGRVAGKKVKATRYGKYDKNGAYLPDPKDGKIYLPHPKGPSTGRSNKGDKDYFAEGYLAGIDEKLMEMLRATSICVPPGLIIR